MMIAIQLNSELDVEVEHKYRELKFLKNIMTKRPMHIELWTQEL